MGNFKGGGFRNQPFDFACSLPAGSQQRCQSALNWLNAATNTAEHSVKRLNSR
nr:MAG TPA: hypothetical protein [Caudoviricetes sp.]